MNDLQRIWLIPLLFLLVLSGPAAWTADDDGELALTLPQLSFIGDEVSNWREGAADWAWAPAAREKTPEWSEINAIGGKASPKIVASPTSLSSGVLLVFNPRRGTGYADLP